MRGSKADIPMFSQFEGTLNWQIEWGGMNVSIETDRPGYDHASARVEVAADLCQCPHWGYVIKGSLWVRYKDYEEVIQAGDVYYLAPGHQAALQEAGEVVEFSPANEYQKTLEITLQNKNT